MEKCLLSNFYASSPSLSFGRIVFRKMERMVVTTTEDPPKMVTNHCGNSCRHPSAWVMPEIKNRLFLGRMTDFVLCHITYF